MKDEKANKKGIGVFYGELKSYIDNTTWSENQNTLYVDTSGGSTTGKTHSTTTPLINMPSGWSNVTFNDIDVDPEEEVTTLTLKAVAGLLAEVNELNKKVDKLLDNT